jgi:hypothetical protein
MPHIDDYPFDPRRPATDVLKLEGLEKLRCVEHPGTRERIFELYQYIYQPKPINPQHRSDR